MKINFTNEELQLIVQALNEFRSEQSLELAAKLIKMDRERQLYDAKVAKQK